MDLLSGLRKGDSSRGGRAEFKWEDVKEDKDRENYLGHSLMAPVGRWQKGRDLTWYAKADSDSTLTAEQQRLEEIRRIKEAENDALSEALGFKVVRRHTDAVNQDDIKRAIKEAGAGGQPDSEEAKGEAQGVGFGRGGKREAAPDKKEDEGKLEGSYRPADEKREGGGRGDRGERKDRDRDGHRSRRHRRIEKGGVTGLIAIDPEDFSLTFSYPPGRLQVSVDGKPDKIVSGVLSITALETLLCREDGRPPAKLPNGNAFKTFRIKRNEQDIGSLFDVRMEFHSKYLSP
ncbi:hypothetical protein P167DRAFT_481484 [Morchella conica CCBAS932]|uniref:Multiple myeloma tumor-associated protein 2-like N-terminal domain-containing protein n=1 Tax=Morchella conica CCBAS932 TaxID=1392247 RepID=A0A3N4L693_9PEZI|nr:hypothetical protein P167DRAFT_481484 [Morchella conica CCBAS932]